MLGRLDLPLVAVFEAEALLGRVSGREFGLKKDLRDVVSVWG